MATARENNISSDNGLGTLSVRVYDIAGNKIRAFFDDADNLVFVIDDTVTPDKPNALLVINSDDGRKWDDILSNDYDVLLEMVRPKKDNKYQKLDIEYAGLDAYDDLIRDHDDGADMSVALTALAQFRRDASRRAATERLASAELAAENARETINRAQDSIAEQQARIKTLRTKLAQQKKSVGREPTKQSAAKILRTESQIDAIRDKKMRAQRRLDNARRRLVVAEEDAEIARAILARHANGDAAPLPTMAPNHDVAPVRNAPVAVVKDTPIAKIEIEEETLEPKAEEMAEEEVKPLFDKDPEILDEEIAFKPIDFGTIPVTPSVAPSSAPRFDDYSDAEPVAPLSFVPPTTDVTPVRDYTDTARPSPVLDTITSVEMPSEPEMQTAPVMPEPVVQPMSNEYIDVPRPAAPVAPTVSEGNVAPMAPVRPASPQTGAPVAVGGRFDNGRPTLLYYVLLIALIVLSVFTLWLYQKKNNDTVPDLAATATAPQEETLPDTANEPDPFIQVEEKVTVTSAPEPEPVSVTPIIDESVPAIPVVAEPEPIEDLTPFFSEPEPEPEPVKAPVVVNKPAYNAGSMNENMFVAAENYDTDVVMLPEPEPVEDTFVETGAVEPVVEYQENEVIQSGITCDDGTLPTEDGCCGDEVYTDIGGGAYACCSETSGQCFAPLF